MIYLVHARVLVPSDVSAMPMYITIIYVGTYVHNATAYYKCVNINVDEFIYSG